MTALSAATIFVAVVAAIGALFSFEWKLEALGWVLLGFCVLCLLLV